MFKTSSLVLLLSVLLCSASALYGKGDVVEVTPSNIKEFTKDFALLEFYAPWCGHCKNLVPEYTKAAKALKGIIKVGAIDADQYKEIGGQYAIQGFPTLKLFTGNGKHQEFNSRTAKEIVAEVMRAATKLAEERVGGKSGGSSSGGSKGSGSGSGSGSGGKSDVIEGTEANFNNVVYGSKKGGVLVEFFAPWCGHCKNLAPHWEEAATKLKGIVDLVAVDATVHGGLASKFGIKGYPTIKFFPAGSSSEADAQDYNGGRTAKDIVDWAMSKAEAAGVGPTVYELTGQELFDEKCKSGATICFLALLPDILDSKAKGRNEQISYLTNAIKKTRGLNFEFFWAEGGSQSPLEEAFRLPFGYPQFVAINMNKKRFATMIEAFDEKNVLTFVEKLKTGRVVTKELPAELPKIKTRTPWDGKDGVAPSEEL